MSQYKRQGQAKRNIRQGKGFVCPTCESLIPRGYEICYNCGDDPIIGSGSSSGVDDDILISFIFFWFAFLAPLVYLFSAVVEPSENPLNLFFLIPSFIMFYSSASAILKKKNRKNLGCLSAPIRVWVLIFSGLAFFNSLQFYIKAFTS